MKRLRLFKKYPRAKKNLSKRSNFSLGNLCGRTTLSAVFSAVRNLSSCPPQPVMTFCLGRKSRCHPAQIDYLQIRGRLACLIGPRFLLRYLIGA